MKQLAVWLVIVSSMQRSLILSLTVLCGCLFVDRKVLMVVFMAVGHSTLLALAQIALAPFLRVQEGSKNCWFCFIRGADRATAFKVDKLSSKVWR